MFGVGACGACPCAVWWWIGYHAVQASISRHLYATNVTGTVVVRGRDSSGVRGAQRDRHLNLGLP